MGFINFRPSRGGLLLGVYDEFAAKIVVFHRL